MLNSTDILETIKMIQEENLDIRTITMGISLLDCIDSDIDKACDKVYDKIMRKAENLVKTGEDIEKQYGIPIVNKRISVTPIAMVSAACKGSPVKFAKALQRAADGTGVNYLGGYSALVHKGFSAGDLELIQSIPEALAETSNVCSSVNIGSTRAGINMDAVAMMGQVILDAAKATKDNSYFGAAKIVVFCNAVEDNPFMAGAFHGVGEYDCETSSKRPRSRSQEWVSSLVRRLPRDSAFRSVSLTSPLPRPPLSVTPSRISSRRSALRAAAATVRPRASQCSTTQLRRAA